MMVAPKPPAGLSLMALSALVGQVKMTLAKFMNFRAHRTCAWHYDSLKATEDLSLKIKSP